MANRVALDVNGCRISQEGDNVLSPSEPLLFDSASTRSGMVYAGGYQSSASSAGVDWSATKGTLGYIPLIIGTDDNAGSKETFSSDVEEYYEGGDLLESTTTHVIPRDIDSHGGSRTATNLKFLVLRIPMQYGKMTDASLWS